MSAPGVFLHRNFVVCTKPGIVVGAEVGAGNSNTQPSCDATLLLFGSEVTYVMLIYVKFDDLSISSLTRL